MSQYISIGQDPFIMEPGGRLEIGSGGHVYESMGDVADDMLKGALGNLSDAQLKQSEQNLALAAALPGAGSSVKAAHDAVKEEIARRKGIPGWLIPVAIGGGAVALWMILKGKKR